MDASEGFEDFVAVVENGSVAAAARRLGIPRPTLSKRLTRLEENLGVRLVHRSTRRLVLTEAGQKLFLRARRIVAEARAAREEVARLDDTPRGLLRVSVPHGRSMAWLDVLVLEFLTRYPEVSLEIVATSRHVDLVAEGVDVALRGGVVADESLIGRTLTRTDSAPVASPAYLARHGVPTTPEDLDVHECLLGFASGESPERSWPLRGGGSVKVQGRLATNDLGTRQALAVAGQGITLLPLRFAADDLDSGRLVPVLEGQIGIEGAITAVWVERDFVDAKVRAFVDLVVDRFDDALQASLAGAQSE